MDMREFYRRAAQLSRLKAIRALQSGDPNAAHEHLKEARKAQNASTLYQPKKVTDIRSVRRRRKER